MKEDRLVRDRGLLEEALLRHEKEKVKRAALRIQQQEEEIKSMIKVSGAFALRSKAGVSHPSQSREC